MQRRRLAVLIRKVGFTEERKTRRLSRYESAGLRRGLDAPLFIMPAFDPHEKAALLNRDCAVEGIREYTA